ncbi:sister chromatid cohesion 1 protein 1-like isoform X1 [Impatiens glandulifera]|uniref:sister chromatid cohesion 1 protein 1-like isoform X1 n=1 Tax=Impatiens glandulifera TaxID=253017 RepID=UPI001FB0ECEB|nr:sister chromatid cohesion 1 protein 1-like isoform X1 [Impatiens glandulifera]
MFYSHQLLARKAPLGQIWMAATLHAKMNRKKLDKLNIIKICEEILNPTVPMALRLSGILMEGVVIVYDRKVKILYEDVTRFMVEINEAWKVKVVPDRTLLPKSKCRANVEAVTLPDNQEEADLGEIEQSLSNIKTKMVFQQSGYFAMRLDSLEDPFVNNNLKEGNPCHQVDNNDITLLDCFNACQQSYVPFNHFERFDIEGDEEMQSHFSHRDAEIPTVNTNSTPNQPKPKKTDEIKDHHHLENQWSEILDQHAENQLNQQPEQSMLDNCTSNNVVVRRTRKPRALLMDYDQMIIPGNVYQPWLQSTDDIVSKKEGKKRKRFNLLPSKKIAKLMDLPPVVLICGLFVTGSGEVYYPPGLLELWRISTHNSPSVTISSDQQQPLRPSSSSRQDGRDYNDPSRYEPFEDFQSGVGSQPLGSSVEKLRTDIHNNDILTGELNNVSGVNNKASEFAEDEVRSNPSSGSAYDFMTLNSDTNSGRLNKKRPYSSSKHSRSGLEPVEEEISLLHAEPNFKLSRLSEDGVTPELLVETGPTQTQAHFRAFDQQVDHMTDCIRMQLKTHFETPGNTSTESLNQLTNGMNKRTAALLFYQTCVLASKDFIRVEQKAAYEDIVISRGDKM